MHLARHITAAGCAALLYLAGGTVAAEVVVVVSASSPVKTLSSSELADIYLGRASRLSGGNPVMPIDQAEGLPGRREFYDRYLGQSAAQIKSHWSKLIFTGRGRPPQSVAGDAAIADFLADHPTAVGYMESEFVDQRLRVVPIE